jgi:hypothetical protein
MSLGYAPKKKFKNLTLTEREFNKRIVSIQGLSELADQNNTVNSSSSGNNRKNVQKNLSSIVITKEAI